MRTASTAPARQPGQKCPGRAAAWLTALSLAGLALVFPCPGLRAQVPPPATPVNPTDLAVLRAGFLRNVLTESQVVTEQYERALAKLEAEIAATGDYEEARLVQQRRDELKALYPSGGSALAQAQGFPLLPSQARLTGATEARGDLLTGWRTGGSAAEWTNLRVTPGKYYLEMEANLTEMPQPSGSLLPGRNQPQEKASFQFHEVSLLAGAEENRRAFDISLNADDATFTPVRVGPVTFTRSPVTVRLTSLGGYPGNLVRLRNPRLQPVTTDVIATAPAAPPGASLEQIRKSLMQALSQAQQPVMRGYLAQLRKLGNDTPELEAETATETKRVLKLMEAARTGTGAPLRLLNLPGGAGGFEVLDGARLAGEAARGDRMTLEHEGRQLDIRLMWVRCGPADADDKSGVKDLAKHFGMQEDAVPELGRMARSFTTSYLEGKTLRLLLRPEKDQDGARRALVFLPEVGLFQNVLVEQGLAAVEQPPKKPRQTLEKALLTALEERENDARRRQSGGWKPSGEGAR